jgi:hypothetical protein
MVTFKLRSEDIDECADAVVQRFSGRWELAREGRFWRATSISAEKITGATPVTTLEDCPGYGDEIQGLSSAEPPPDYYEDPDYYDDSYSEPNYDDNPDYDYDRDYDDYDPDYGSDGTTEDFGRGQGRIGLCEDGTLSDSIGRQGACSHHGGVAD